MRVLPLLLALVLVLPGATAEFGPEDALGWPIGIDGESHNPFLVQAAPVNAAGPATLYPYYPILTAEVQRLADEHPDLVRLTSAGKSTLGLDIWMLEVANFAELDAGTAIPLEEREVIWLDGGTHSNEYSGVYFVLAATQFLLDQYDENETAKWIVDNRHTWIMPMVNPDGSNAFGRLNANGVNINRNYPVVWDGEGNDLIMNNRGPEPASEVETQINIEWFNKTQPDYYASIHCCGNLWLYPYGEQGVNAVDDPMMSRMCDEVFADIRDRCGPIWSTIYPASGSSIDTAYEYTGAAGFGYEMSGRNFIRTAAGIGTLWGPPFSLEPVLEQEHESWGGLKHAFLNVERYGAFPEIVALESGDALRVLVRNTGYGNLTAGDVTLGDDVVALPFLAPDEEVWVTLETPADGEHDLVINYQKRLMAAPMGSTGGVLAVADGTVSLLGPDELLPLQGVASKDAPQPLLLPVVFGLLALAFWVRRK